MHNVNEERIGVGQEITEMFVYVADHGETGEGIVSVRMDEGWMPLVSYDLDKAMIMMNWANQIARNQEIEIKLVRFTERTVIARL